MKDKSYLKGFKWSGPKYRRSAIPVNDWEPDFWERSAIDATTRILLVGSGDGALVERLAKRARFVAAIEFDDKAYAAALRDPRFAGNENIFFLKADPCAIPSNVPHGPYDIVISHMAANRCPNMTRLLSRFIRQAKEGGKVYLEFAGAGDCDTLYQTILKVAQEEAFASYLATFRYPFQLIDALGLKQLMLEAAFAKEKTEARTFAQVIDEKAFTGWLARWAAKPWLDLLPEAVHDDFLQAVAGAYPRTERGRILDRVILTGEGMRNWGDLSGDLYPFMPPASLD